MDKHYLSDQARGLAMAARSVDEKNLITQAANELDAMWLMCNNQAKEITNLNGRIDSIVAENNVLRERTENEILPGSVRSSEDLKALIKCTDRRSYRVLSKLYRKNDTPETLYKRITRTNLTNYRNVGEVTKGNIYKLFEDLGVANG